MQFLFSSVDMHTSATFLIFAFFAEKNLSKRKKKPGRFRKYIIAFIGVVLLFVLAIAFSFYQKVYAPNVAYSPDKPFLYIPTNATYNNLLAILSSKKIVENVESFEWVANRMNLQNNIHPGRYRLQPRMNNYDLV